MIQKLGVVKVNADILVIGSGPAGLNAAYIAASKGAKVIVVDEAFTVGGQLKQQTQLLEGLPKNFESQSGISLVETLNDRLKSLPITVLQGYTMIGLYKNGRVGVTDGKKTFPISYKKIIIATGAAEEATVFPGWTLPGVMTVGAAQILINRERVLPGRNAIIVGVNSFSLEVAKQLQSCGINIIAMIAEEISSDRNELLCDTEATGIRIVENSYIVSASGPNEVEKVILSVNNVEEEHDIDVVCIGKGVSPILEAFEILSCEFTYREELGGLFPKYYSTFETSTPSVYLAGNAAGITNIGAILVTGEIAAWNALYSLEIITNVELENELKALWNSLCQIEKSRSFQARISSIKQTHKESDLAFPQFIHLLLEGC